MTLRERIAHLRAHGRLWQPILPALDVAAIAVATAAAYLARFEGRVPDPFAPAVAPAFLAAAVVYVTCFAAFGLYRVVLRYVGVDTVVRLGGAVGCGFAVLLAVDTLAPGVADMRAVPFGVLFIQALLVLLGGAGSRLAARVIALWRAARLAGGRAVLIAGAGSAGSLLLREIADRPDLGLTPVGFLDDDPALAGRTVGGVPVVGTTDRLAEAAARHGATELLVAMPSAPASRVRRLLNDAADAGMTTRVTPSLVIAKGSVSVTDLRPVDVEDLLGREPTPIDTEQVRDTISGRRVLVTGAAGSIGSELAHQVAALAPAELVLLDTDETRLFELMLALAPAPCVAEVCDIRDAPALRAVMARHRPAIVLHAAAYKHVPLMELAPAEAVKTNVGGTRTLIDACHEAGCDRFVLISTDKAVAPANVMGLTKALAERLTLRAARERGMTAMAVRFGNVLGSRGSVVPVFTEQLRRGGPLTVTDPEVTRYFMTIPEAARLVLQAQAIGAAGDVFVLEMGEPVRIADLARKMIALSGVPAEVVFTGLRPGEKLHEELTASGERVESSGRAGIARVLGVPAADDGLAATIDDAVRAAEAADDGALAAALTDAAARL